MGCGASKQSEKKPEAKKPEEKKEAAAQNQAGACQKTEDKKPEETKPEKTEAPKEEPKEEPKEAEKKEEELPKSRVAVFKAVSTVLARFASLKATDKGISEDEIITEITKEGVPENQAEEILDNTEDTDGDIDEAQLTKGMGTWKSLVLIAATEIKKPPTEDKVADAKLKLQAVNAFLDANSAKKNEVQKKTASLRTLALVAELAAELKPEEKDDDLAGLIEDSCNTMSKEVLAKYDENEKEINDLVSNPDRKADLRKLWKDVDFNGSRKISTVEFNYFIRKTYPTFVQPCANKAAFKATLAGGDGDEWVERKEFADLLRNLVAYNKLYFVFATIDSSDDRRIEKDEYIKMRKKTEGSDFDAAEAEETWSKIDVDGSGKLTFREFTKAATQVSNEKNIAAPIPIEDDEE